MKLSKILPNTKLYSHRLHIHVLEQAHKHGVITSDEMNAIATCDDKILMGRRLKGKDVQSFDAKDRVFLFDLQSDKCLVKDILQRQVAVAHNFKDIADIYNTAIYFDPKQDGKFEAIMPMDITIKGTYSFELTDEGVMLNIDAN